MRIIKSYAKTALCITLSAAMLFMDMGVPVSAAEYPQEETQDNGSAMESSVGRDEAELAVMQTQTEGLDAMSEEETSAEQNEETPDTTETAAGENSAGTMPVESKPETEIETEEMQTEEISSEAAAESEPETETKTEEMQTEVNSAETMPVESESETQIEEIQTEESSLENVTESESESEMQNMESVNAAFSDTDIAYGEYKENGNDITWTISADGKLTVEGKGDYLRDYYDEDFVDTARPSWLKYRNQILTAEIKVTGMTDASHMFEACNNLTSVDLSGLDISKVTNMSAMFYGCWSLESVDLSGFDTSKVTDMEYMFACCFKLKSVDLSNFNTSNVTRMFSMFMSCKELTSVNLSSFDIRKVTSTGWMFIDCDNIRSLDLSSFDASNTDMSSIFGMEASPCEPDTLYTPRNVKQEVELYRTMYDMAGNAYDKLPMNREDSILLQSSKQPEAVTAHITAAKTKRAYVCGEILNTDDITVRYYGTDGSVKELAQTEYTTNAAEIDMSTEGEKTLTVTYNNMTADIKLTVSKKEENSGENEEDKDDSPYTDQERTELTAVNAVIANIKSKVYDGSAYKPVVRVTATVNGGKKTTLTEGADYRVLYQDNINAGEGKVIVKGNGIYKGQIEKKFTITPKPIKSLKIVTGSISGEATKESASDAIYVYDGTKLLTPETDYEVSDSRPVNNRRGIVQVTIRGKGNYSGTSASQKLNVYDAGTQIIQPENVTLNKTSVPYTGKAIKDIKVTVSIDGKELNPKIDYTVQYQNNKNAGTAYVIVTGKKAYKGKAVVPFTITAETVQNPDDFKVREIKAVTYNGKTQNPSVRVTIKKNGRTKTLSKKDYTVTYKDNFHAGTATVTVTGKGNYEGLTATAHFTIKPQQIRKVSVKGTQGKLVLTYNKKTLKEGTDYEEPEYGRVTKNKVAVTIKGKGDFTGTITKNIKVQ